MIYLCADADSLSQKEVDLLCSFLSEERLEKLSKKKEDKNAALLSYALFGLLLKTPGLNFSCGAHNAPYLKGFPDLTISLSHTKGAAAVGISSHPIGVDIEKSNRTLSDKVFLRMTDKEEAARFNKAAKEDRIALWTLKESYLKYRGTGLSAPLTSVSFYNLYPPECSDTNALAFCGRYMGYTYSFVGDAQEKVFPIRAKEVVRGVKKMLNL